MKKILKIIYQIALHVFALIGLALSLVYLAVTFGLTNTKGIVDLQRNYFQNPQGPSNDETGLDWNQDAEWQTFKAGITKDAPVVDQAAQMSGASPRMIVAVVAVEQLRFYHTDRESYKKYFAPLSMLGAMSQYAWGLAGVKPDTAKEIESNLASTTSPYYLGDSYAHLLDFSTSNHDQERFDRLTDQHNHLYSYLYAGLYISQVIHQWKAAGIDISNNPGVIATLFNVGFSHSLPHADPQIGGAEIDINGKAYSFGGLAAEFYNSSELTDVFPQ